MIRFNSYISETFSSEDDKSHYTHIEDELYVSGKAAIPKIIASFTELVRGIPTTITQTKIDGAPSIFYGYHQTNGKFFVATKAIFNVTPKINFTNSDIVRNHGEAPGLVKKLKLALKYLPLITNNKTVIMQGDVMFAPEDLEKTNIENELHYLFKPNLIVNAVPVNSELGNKISRSKFGFAPHTKYNSKGQRVAITKADIKNNSSVFVMPVDAPSLSQIGLDDDVENVKTLVGKLSASTLSYVSSEPISAYLLQYANDVIRKEAEESYDGFFKFVSDKLQKEVDKVKTEKTKEVKKEAMNKMQADLRAHRSELIKIIDVHKKIAIAKDKIVAELDKAQPIRRYFKNEFGNLIRTNPEGYVTLNRKGTSKFINRREFSKQNFAMGAFRKITNV